ncbi:DUF6089 family protein [Catalinimonas alkaloidigena]|nr:DUF6089 family protein [Catalinimonas alkaloidigena]
MKKLFLLLVLFVGMFALDFEAQAQQRRRQTVMRRQSRRISTFTSRVKFAAVKRYATVGVSVGAANYFGDLVPRTSVISTDFSLTRPSIGIYATKRIHPHVEVGGSFSWIRISGSDFRSQDPDDPVAKYRYLRNLHFRNDVKELSLFASYDLIGNNSVYIRRAPLNPYVFGGIGVYLHEPRAKAPEEFGGKWEALRPLRTEGQTSPYSSIQLDIPLGIGVKYAVATNFDLAFEIGYRINFTDYLDDVSTFFPDPADLPSDLARAMSYRSGEANDILSGDPRNLDAVMPGNFTVVTNPDFPSAQYIVVKSSKGNAETQGYGPGSIRGNQGKDFFIVTALKLRYIIANRGTAPKFR